MSNITIEPKRLQGKTTVPSDKSISHRIIIIGSLARGKTHVKNLSTCQDCLRTLEAFRDLGISITKDKDLSYYIQGRGLDGLRRPKKRRLYLGNSGTSMRLILGALAGQRFSCELGGDASLSKRPMNRVIRPLSLMGAKIKGRDGDEFAPLTIKGASLRPIHYEMPVASAQVKSAILLAGLYADGTTTVSEPFKSRDHTERMLKIFGADIISKGLSVSVKGRAALVGNELEVPGDISSASFFLVGACICRDSSVTVESVGLNPTRIGFLNILQKMQASISWNYQDSRMAEPGYNGEAKGEISARFSHLKALTIKPEHIPSLIDELPILMVAATQSEGTTVIQNAAELRIKETDRINAMVCNLSKMGADIESSNDDVIIHGPSKLKGCVVDSFNDHRTAMSMAIAGLVARGRTTIKNVDCVKVSFPGFFEMLSGLFS